MQNNIFNFALNHADINKTILCTLCDQMDEEMRERFVNALIGIVDMDEIERKISRYSSDRNGERWTFESYNYLLDRVYYTYEHKDKRYFKTQEDADKFAETGDYDYGKSKYCEEGEYNIKAIFSRPSSSYTSLYNWEKGEEK